MKHPIPLLLYHQVNDNPSEAGATTRDAFRGHLRWLATKGYRSITLAEFERLVDAGYDPGPRRFLLSFDDGCADLEICAPILREFGFTAVAFVPTGLVGSDPGYIGWSALARLAASGTIEVQSHSHLHERWPTNTAHADMVADDLRRSRELIAKHVVGSSAAYGLRHLAWPWGRCTKRLEQIALQSGFTYQYLVQRGAVTRKGSSVRLPRLCCDGFSEARFAGWMQVLSSYSGARIANQCFGWIRRLRSGLGYTEPLSITSQL